MAACKCRHCQAKLTTDTAYKVVDDSKKLYFCNKEHYVLFQNKIDADRQAKEEAKRKEKEEAERKRLIEKEKKQREREEAKQKKIIEKEARQKEENEAKEQRKADKNKVYTLICEIIGRKEIINTALWKEWKVWNLVASNETIGRYLDANKKYLTEIISKLDNIEFNRIRYLSAIIKCDIGDFGLKPKEAKKMPVKIEVSNDFYQPVATKNNKRRSLADLEDEF